MVPDGYTFGAAARQPAHRSVWFERLRRRAPGVPVEDWLVHQANLRGFYGAYLREPLQAPLDVELSLEEIVVGLLSPAAELDGRALKLVYWLVSNAPVSERTGAVAALERHWTAPPRGFRGIRYDYDFARLVQRRASREQLWRRAQSS